GDMAPDTPWRPQADTRLQQTFCRLDDKGGDDAIFEDMLLLIHIINEQIEGLNTLLQATLDDGPVGGFHNPWNNIERKNPLCPSFVAIHVESDPHVEEGLLGSPLAMQQFHAAITISTTANRPSSPPLRASPSTASASNICPRNCPAP